MSLCACVGESSLRGGVHTVQRAQGLLIAIVEEIAYENGWITREQLMESAERYGKSPYGQHLKGHRRRRDHARAESEELT